MSQQQEPRDRFSELKPETQLELIMRLHSLKESVHKLSMIYERCEELNDLITLGNLIPMSIDDWYAELAHKVHEYESQVKKIRIICHHCGLDDLDMEFRSFNYNKSSQGNIVKPGRFVHYRCNRCWSTGCIDFLPGMAYPTGVLIYPPYMKGLPVYHLIGGA